MGVTDRKTRVCVHRLFLTERNQKARSQEEEDMALRVVFANITVKQKKKPKYTKPAALASTFF